jgi:hypothetical protein
MSQLRQLIDRDTQGMLVDQLVKAAALLQMMLHFQYRLALQGRPLTVQQVSQLEPPRAINVIL